MLCSAGQAINLIPDRTVIPQLFIFLAVTAVLTIFVFRPLLKIMDARREKTGLLEEEAARLVSESESMEREYEETLAAARIDGERTERELVRLGESEAQTIIAGAKEESRRRTARLKDEISKESVGARGRLTSDVDAFADMICQKVLGKK